MLSCCNGFFNFVFFCRVLFHFDRNDNKKIRAKVHPPRMDGKSVGVFATRSPHRPNPIGLSLVKLVKIEGIFMIFKKVKYNNIAFFEQTISFTSVALIFSIKPQYWTSSLISVLTMIHEYQKVYQKTKNQTKLCQHKN